MRTRSIRGGSALVFAAGVVAALVTSASGAVRSPSPAWKYPGGEPERLAYETMNRLAQELRTEVNRAEPNAAVVVDLKARLRLLANQPAR